MRLLVIWLIGVPAFLAFLFNVLDVQEAEVFAPTALPVSEQTDSLKSGFGTQIHGDETAFLPLSGALIV